MARPAIKRMTKRTVSLYHQMDATFLAQLQRRHTEIYKGYFFELEAGIDNFSDTPPWDIFEGESQLVKLRNQETQDPAHFWLLTHVTPENDAGDGDCHDRLVFDHKKAYQYFWDNFEDLKEVWSASESRLTASLGHAPSTAEWIDFMIQSLYNEWKLFAVGKLRWLCIAVSVLDAKGQRVQNSSRTQRMLRAGEHFDEEWENAIEGARHEIDILISEN